MLRKIRKYWLVICWMFIGGTSGHASAEQWTISAVENSTLTQLSQAIVIPAYAELGINIQIAEFPPMRALRYSSNGLVDGELFRIRGIETIYPSLIPIPVPLFTGDIVAFTMDPALAMTPINDNPDARVLIRRGVISADLATRGMNREVVDSYEQMVSMMQAGRAQYGVFSRVHTWISLKGATLDDVFVLTEPLSHFELLHYVHEKHTERVGDIAAALQFLHDSGLTEQILKSLETNPELFD